jgi:hypothetical protein
MLQLSWSRNSQNMIAFLIRTLGRTMGSSALLAIGLSSIACSTESRHRVIVYDQAWSSAAAVKNLWCAPQLRTACERQAREEELSFPDTLSRAFRSAPECATVAFLVLSENDKSSEELKDRLSRDPGSVYWRLQVDFQPGLTRQGFTLGPGTDPARNGGDDAEHEVSFICKAAKDNGVMATW